MGIRMGQGFGLQTAHGTYTGDGNPTQVITGLPFTPKYLEIIGYIPLENSATWFCFDPENTGGCIAIYSATTEVGSFVTSFNVGGFTVNDAVFAGGFSTNTLGIQYNWVAIG